MEILVTDRAGIHAGIRLDCPYIIISIHNPDQPPAKIPTDPNLRAILALAFDDCRHAIRDTDTPELSPMTAAHAAQIRDFVRLHQPHIAAIVVHCEQGFSRSPAIAAAVSETLGLDPCLFWQGYGANRDVYDMVMDAFEPPSARYPRRLAPYPLPPNTGRMPVPRVNARA